VAGTLHNDLELLLDFYLKQRANPPEVFTHAAGVIPSPSFFTVEALQAHVNNPLLSPEWVRLFAHDKVVNLEPACMYKSVQSNQLQFIDKAFIDQHLENGAAMVLEGIDILDPSINAFVAELDEALPCSLSNCVAMFSQSGNEAYGGHCDVDDVLVIQLSGEKLWNIYTPQHRRYGDTNMLTPEQMGARIKELNMRPGDALYLRAGVPHRCQTTGDHSLHLAFDLIDSTPGIKRLTKEANQQYLLACEDAYADPEKVIERYISLLESPDYRNFLQTATQSVKAQTKAFRQSIGRASGVRALQKFCDREVETLVHMVNE